MRHAMFLILFLLLNIDSWSQVVETYYSLRNYNSSLVLSLTKNRVSQFAYKDYGGMKLSSENGAEQLNSYLYQGQASDKDLGVYLYPSRIYSISNGRFFTPDPKSQYNSPYLFVNADPVNVADRDGNEGIPIVFYSENQSALMGMNESMFDFFKEVQDVYYIPLPEFFNGTVGDIPEWNGNVFIKGHIGVTPGRELEVERARNVGDLTASADNLTHIKANEGRTIKATADAEEFGRRLRHFSESRGVPVKRVVAGGCEGADAAERIGMGYVGKGERMVGRELETVGLKPGMNSLVAGGLVTSEKGAVVGLNTTRYHVQPKDSRLLKLHDFYEGADGRQETHFVRCCGSIRGGSPYDLPYVEGKELNDLANGRIPKKIEPFFEKYHFAY